MVILSARRNQQHPCPNRSGNECHKWFSRLCKLERNTLANIFIKSRIRRELQTSSMGPLGKRWKRPAISAETGAKQENLELIGKMDRLQSFIADR